VKACFEIFIDAEADGGVGELAKEGGGESIVETKVALLPEDMDKSAQHGFGVGWRAGLKANLDWEVERVEVNYLNEWVVAYGIPRSSGWVTMAAIEAALPPNQKG
jgi:hypothetical protein